MHIVLGQQWQIKKEESLYCIMQCSRAKNEFGEDSPVYFSVLFYYAEYLREFKIDNNKALEYFKLCIDYLSKNKQ